MAKPEVGPETTLRIERTFAAPRPRVFEAWTRPEVMAIWMAPSDDYQVTVPVCDVRPGGQYVVVMRHKDGNVHTVRGAYREVSAPSRLVFTWAWQEHPDRGDTLVTVELHEEGRSTRLVLVHERFPSAEVRDRHNAGWVGCFDRLAQTL